MARLYADEHFPRKLSELLRVLGHDVLTVQEAGNANQQIPDEEVLSFATKDQRAVITMNRRDFVLLHRQQPSHSGIIVCTHDSDLVGQADRIHEAIEEVHELSNQLLRINRPS